MVQNQYLEFLLELGIVGLILFAVLFFGLLKKTKHQKYLWVIVAAFAVQWWFFSGYPNTLHIFIILALVYAYSQNNDYSTASKRDAVRRSKRKQDP